MVEEVGVRKFHCPKCNLDVELEVDKGADGKRADLRCPNCHTIYARSPSLTLVQLKDKVVSQIRAVKGPVDVKIDTAMHEGNLWILLVEVTEEIPSPVDPRRNLKATKAMAVSLDDQTGEIQAMVTSS